jgi:hypothetical protein
MKFTKTLKTKLRVKDGIIVHLQLLTKTRPEAKEAIDVFKNDIKDIKYKYDKKTNAFNWDVLPVNNSKEVAERITKVMALDIITAVVQFIEGIKPEEVKKEKFKRSGHLTDQILKYKHPKDESGQLILWETLKERTKEKIEIAKRERSEIVEGIKLTPSETKVIDCLCKLLHQNSQTVEPKDNNYFTGNLEPSLQVYGDEKTPAPKLAITLYELTKEYIGEDKRVDGKSIENVANILVALSDKQFLLRYKEETHKKGGGKIVKELEMFQKIVNLPTFRVREYSKEDIEISKTEETLVVLHPIFRRQIDSKFILYPVDINKRTIIAYGNNKVSEATLRLRDYLMRELSSKHYNPEIMLDRLYYLLAEKQMRESRKAKVKKDTDKALETVKKLGLLKSYKTVKAKTTGEPKVVFTLNKDFD